MPKVTAQLDMAVKAVAPIVGVHVGRWDDRSTWHITFADEATQEQREAANSALSAFNVDAAALAIAKSHALSALAAAVSAARTKYAPNAEHQTVIYDVKAQEADAYIAAGRPADASPFPLLSASAAAKQRSVSEHADLIVARRAQWIQVAAATEGLREAGEDAIRAAANVDAVNSALAFYVTQLELI